jgi:hypothetical protein
MKRPWIVVLVASLAAPAIALAQEPVGAWCGGSYGAHGTNFAECAAIERQVQVAGQGSGLTQQTVQIPTRPEYPAMLVTFEDGQAFVEVERDGKVTKQRLDLNWAAAPDRSHEFQSGGDGPAGEE